MTFRKDVKSKDQVAGRGAKKQGTREGLPAGALRVETDTPTEKKTIPALFEYVRTRAKLLLYNYWMWLTALRSNWREIHQGRIKKYTKEAV